MSLEKIIKKIFAPETYWLVVALVCLEVFSYIGFSYDKAEPFFFFFFVALVFFLSFKNLRYGVIFAVMELVIGSKGYLLHLDFMGISISIRMAIWLILMSVWLKLFVFSFLKKSLGENVRIKSVFTEKEILNRGFLKNFFLLFLFVLVGVINGLRLNDFGDAFLDLNGWLFLLFIFPLYEVVFNKHFWLEGEDTPFWSLAKAFSAGFIWLIAKTFIVLFVFSHTFDIGWISTIDFYRWIRNTGVGEITNMPSGFVRVFFQSHFYALFIFHVLMLVIGRFWGEIVKNKRMLISVIVSLSLVVGVIVVSFSRSFWVGLVLVMPVYLFLAFKRFGVKRILISCSLLALSFVISLVLIFVVVKFPYPKASANFGLVDALSDRAKNVSGEAAVSSRNLLLPVIVEEIKASPIMGHGFGKAVVYKTKDPRALEGSPDGLYRTYTFEWGWLDIWVKMGVLGLLAYLFLLYGIVRVSIEKGTFWCEVAILGLLVFFMVNIFTPYANHPLGFGFLLLLAALVSWEKKPCPCA